LIEVVIARLKQGHRTVRYPAEPPKLPDRYQGCPSVDASKCQYDTCDACRSVCPTDAIQRAEQGVRIDLGKCLFCSECQRACASGALTSSSIFQLSTRTRDELWTSGMAVPRVPAPDPKFARLFGRSLKLRQVSAGGCNACEADLNVLTTVVFDIGRFGIEFVASPRHADGLLVTGPVTRSMEAALMKTYEAVPSPKIVIASGVCAISGGPFAGHPEVKGGVAGLLPVDLFIPGCPPSPYTVLDGLLGLIDRLPGAARKRDVRGAEHTNPPSVATPSSTLR
jgi:Ni,Fe-hydrogenase III small subunit/ferredoxin